MNLTLLTSTLSTAAGGLSVSVPNLARSLERAGADQVQVVGVEDPNDSAASSDWGSHVFAHRQSGLRAFGYAVGMQHTLARLAPDVIDVQGLWTYPSLANLRHHHSYNTPYVVTPRGMLDPWARERSKWKKRAVRLWFEDTHLAQATCLRATAEMEAEHFRSFGLHNPIAVVPNGVDVPHSLPTRSIDERRRLLFLSRIHPKKGISPLLRAWAAIEKARPQWELVIAGPDEVGHTAEMQTLARSLNLQRVEWRTAVHGEAKSALYRSADCFVLPTHAENFGLVVAEALAHEVPVITTRNAPWEGLHRHKCGWWIDLDEARLRDTLLEATAQPRHELWEMGARGRNWMQRDFAWDGVAEKMAEVYRWVLAGGKPPEYMYVA
jgi:glycosyltransferase involved in cell wall biosynthesis